MAGLRRLTSKLAFVHRTLWQREQAYRWAALLGPPPLLGCAVAALAWTIAQHWGLGGPAPAAASTAPWAHWTRPAARDGQPFAEAPTAPVPPHDAGGGFPGYQQGWIGEIHPMTVDAMQDPNVGSSVLARLTIDQPGIQLARFLDAGPSTGLFVGEARALLVVRTAGDYAVSARLVRDGLEPANCVVRLASAHHQMLRNLALDVAPGGVLNFPATEFQLQPGFFLLQALGGCWHGDRPAGAGELTILVRHPGETALKPLSADEVVRPAPRGGAVAATQAAH